MPGVLALQTYSVNPQKDTSLQTLHGAIIKIEAASFSTNDIIQVEVREAYTAAEIFSAGLVTESNGKPLRSGGMIYINAFSKGEKLDLVKPVKVSIPNQYFDRFMQIFKGVETDSGTINWVDPQPADTTPQSNQWQSGQELFKAKCTSCHAIFTDGTGPALAGIENRGPWLNRKNIYAFTRNPAVFIAGDRYAKSLLEKYRSMMTAFPELQDYSIDAILAYFKNEEKRPGAKEEEQNYRDSLSKVVASNFRNFKSDSVAGIIQNNPVETNPCKDDTIYIPVAKSEQSFFESTSFPMPPDIDDTLSDLRPAKPESLEGFREGFNDPNPTSGMYDFEIRTLGWYNVDAFVEGYAGTTNVKVSAQLQVGFDITMHLYLFVPRNKMLSVGILKSANYYSFDKLDGGIPLFLDDRAILFAFGSKGDKMYYGISEFTIQHEQTIQIKIEETTSAEIKTMLFAKQIDGIDIGIEKKEMRVISPPCNDGSEADYWINN